ncbi:MAG: hypothetical protein A3K19_02250 [Lentisphaerae bacterium RIFOXYB12_FULL_65_16]|nr:MAG: hypothetical protein A3K19_02250 [Lentisphaerae bacterium RIFOXYB12_FULL_65_16]
MDTTHYVEDLGASISFHILRAGRAQPREPGFDTGWRRLTAPLLETPLRGVWELGMEGQRAPVFVQPGEVAVVPAGVLHRLRVPGNDTVVTHFLLAQYLWVSGLDVLGLVHPPVVLRAPAGERLAPLLAELGGLHNPDHSRLTDIARLQELGFRVLQVVLDCLGVRDTALPTSALARLRPALDRMRASRGASPTCVDLAQAVQLSSSRFNTVFKQAVGVAPKVYMRTLQLRRGCELLIHQSDLPVYAVASECGFASAYYFCRQFHRYIGQTPTAFRASFVRARQA